MRADVHAVQADRGRGHDTANPPWSVQPRPGANDHGDRDGRVARRVSGPSRVGRIAVKEHVREIGGRAAPIDDELHDVVDQIGEDPCCGRSRDQGPEDIASGHGEHDDHGDDQQGESDRSEQWVDEAHHGAEGARWVVEPPEHRDLGRTGWARRGDGAVTTRPTSPTTIANHGHLPATRVPSVARDSMVSRSSERRFIEMRTVEIDLGSRLSNRSDQRHAKPPPTRAHHRFRIAREQWARDGLAMTASAMRVSVCDTMSVIRRCIGRSVITDPGECHA